MRKLLLMVAIILGVVACQQKDQVIQEVDASACGDGHVKNPISGECVSIQSLENPGTEGIVLGDGKSIELPTETNESSRASINTVGDLPASFRADLLLNFSGGYLYRPKVYLEFTVAGKRKSVLLRSVGSRSPGLYGDSSIRVTIGDFDIFQALADEGYTDFFNYGNPVVAYWSDPAWPVGGSITAVFMHVNSLRAAQYRNADHEISVWGYWPGRSHMGLGETVR